jgi:hypothetical protein
VKAKEIKTFTDRDEAHAFLADLDKKKYPAAECREDANGEFSVWSGPEFPDGRPAPSEPEPEPAMAIAEAAGALVLRLEEADIEAIADRVVTKLGEAGLV